MSCCFTKFIYDLPYGSPLRCLIESVARGVPNEKLWLEIIENPEQAEVRLSFSTPEEVEEAYALWILAFLASAGNCSCLPSRTQFRGFLKRLNL